MYFLKNIRCFEFYYTFCLSFTHSYVLQNCATHVNQKHNLSHIHSIELAIDSKCKNILITGDFNENQINSTIDSKINQLCNIFNLVQLIKDPTSKSENSNTLIDLLLTNNSDMIVHSSVIEPFLEVNIRYHCPIISILKQDTYKYHSYKRKIWLYDKGNFADYRNKLSQVDWDAVIIPSDSLENSVHKFTAKILDVASECIPSRIITIRKNELPWITNEIRKNMRIRDRFRKKAKKLNSPYYFSKFKFQRNKVVDLLRSAKRDYHESICNKIKQNKFCNKDWWKLVKQLSFCSNKSNEIKVLVTDDNDIISDDHEKAEYLNSFFASQSIIDDSNK